MRATILPLILLLAGCAQLKVQVDIFDPRGLSEPDVVESTVAVQASRHAAARTNGVYDAVKADLKSQLGTHLGVLVEKGLVAKSQLELFRSALDRKVEAGIDSVVSLRDAGAAEAAAARVASDPAERRTGSEAAAEQFRLARSALADFRREFVHAFDQQVYRGVFTLDPFEKAEVLRAQREFEQGSAAALRTLTGGHDLLRDPLAGTIIAAGDEYWENEYNRSVGTGLFGNTDIAIKMENAGTFTIKGLRVDSSKLTQASFQVLKQGVRMVAAAYGVPVPGDPAAPAAGSSGASPSDVVTDAESRMIEAEQGRLLSRQAALAVLETILLERDELESGDTARRNAALSHIKSAFEAYRTQLAGE